MPIYNINNTEREREREGGGEKERKGGQKGKRDIYIYIIKVNCIFFGIFSEYFVYAFSFFFFFFSDLPLILLFI